MTATAASDALADRVKVGLGGNSYVAECERFGSKGLVRKDYHHDPLPSDVEEFLLRGCFVSGDHQKWKQIMETRGDLIGGGQALDVINRKPLMTASSTFINQTCQQ